MKKFLFTISLFLGLGLLMPKAEAATDTDISGLDNTIYVTSVDAKPGDELTLSIQMKNAIEVTGFQIDIELPEGLSIVMYDEYAEADISAARLTSTRSHMFGAEFQEDGSLRLLCYSNKNVLFLGNSGEIATVKVKVDDNASGLLSIHLKEIVLTDATGKTLEADDVYFSVKLPTEESLEDYDLNKDGHVNIADVTSLVNFILKHPELK